MEHMENERAIYGKVGKRSNFQVVRKVPSQTDESGSAIRIRNQRPQTPRINLLKLGRQEYKNSHHGGE